MCTKALISSGKTRQQLHRHGPEQRSNLCCQQTSPNYNSFHASVQLSCTAIQLWNLPAAASSPPAKLGGRGGGMAALPSPTAGQHRKGAALLNMSNADRGAHGKHLIRALIRARWEKQTVSIPVYIIIPYNFSRYSSASVKGLKLSFQKAFPAYNYFCLCLKTRILFRIICYINP